MAKISTVFAKFQELGCDTKLMANHYAFRGTRPQLMRALRRAAARQGCKIYKVWAADYAAPHAVFTKWL